MRKAATVAEEATVAGGNGTAVSSGAGSLRHRRRAVASELKTLDTYLTTTPTGQLDPGYVASQTAYLTRQLTRLQGTQARSAPRSRPWRRPCASSAVTQMG